MKTIFEHIESMRGKPHDVRRQTAFSLAAGASTLIALVWFFGNISTGSFAIHGTDFAATAEQKSAPVADDSSDKGLAGAAASLQSADAPAHIEIIDTISTATTKRQAEKTILPF